MADQPKQPIWGNATFTIENTNYTSFIIQIAGRCSWAFDCIMTAGGKGCTPIETPYPKWHGYIHNLRNLGIVIETASEGHGGPFKGTHARYVLRSVATHSDGTGVAT